MKITMSLHSNLAFRYLQCRLTMVEVSKFYTCIQKFIVYKSAANYVVYFEVSDGSIFKRFWSYEGRTIGHLALAELPIYRKFIDGPSVNICPSYVHSIEGQHVYFWPTTISLFFLSGKFFTM